MGASPGIVTLDHTYAVSVWCTNSITQRKFHQIILLFYKNKNLYKGLPHSGITHICTIEDNFYIWFQYKTMHNNIFLQK